MTAMELYLGSIGDINAEKTGQSEHELRKHYLVAFKALNAIISE